MSQQVHALYALIDEYKVKVPDVDRAGYATMDSAYAALKVLVEDVEGSKDAFINKHSGELEAGKLSLPMSSQHCPAEGNWAA